MHSDVETISLLKVSKPSSCWAEKGPPFPVLALLPTNNPARGRGTLAAVGVVSPVPGGNPEAGKRPPLLLENGGKLRAPGPWGTRMAVSYLCPYTRGMVAPLWSQRWTFKGLE